MDIVSEECFEPHYNLRLFEINKGTFTRTSSKQDLPVILKWHTFQSLEKALICYGIKICKSDVYFLNRHKNV